LYLFRNIVNRARLISVSDANRSNLARLLSVDPNIIKTIPNRPTPICTKIRQSERAQLLSSLDLDPSHFICTTVAALVPRKGHEDVIRASRLVVNQDPSYRFLFIGSGQHEAALRSLVQELELTQNIFFLGHRADVHKLLQVSQAFVFPSMSEGLSFALMEAVQYNLPLIASTQSSAVEFLIPTVHYKSYENGDIPTLTRHLLAIKTNYQDSINTASCAAEALQNYNFNDMFSDTAAIIFRS
jgi:glycosyltransferase involved in cell wall biosynthesis